MDKDNDQNIKIQKFPRYPIEELKKNSGLLQRGLEDLGITSDDFDITQLFAEFFAELDEMKDGNKQEQEEELKERWADPRAKDILVNALSGEDCEKISNGFGDFGTSPTNPIPVNGVVGEYKYLNRLRFGGQRLMYHRLGFLMVEELGGLAVDVYEVVTMDGRHWDALCFDFYHPRRSRAIPAGYICSSDSGSVQERILNACTIGTNAQIETFPYGMEDRILEKNREILGKVARNLYREAVKDRALFIRPE